jgi:Zn-dependent peptidase ImmA (M78 family)
MLAAAHAHADYGIDTTRLVDVFTVIEQAELILGFEPMPKLSGAYYSGAGVLINSNHPLARQRYTAGHEFGHHVFGHETSVDPLVEPLTRWGTTTRWPPHEKQAEAFAAWFLMPKKLIDTTLEQLELQKPGTSEDVYALALRLGTSFEATALHLRNLRLADQSQVKAWLDLRLADIKRELAVGGPPESLRSDVWRLGDRERGFTFSVRVGDRLVVELADTPSSGYVWKPAAATERQYLVLDSFLRRPQLADTPTDDIDERDGGAVPHFFVLEIDDDAGPGGESVAFERIRPWTGEVIDRYELALDIQRPRRGVSEEWLKVAA